MKNSMLAVSIAVTFAIAGCEQGLTPSAAVPDAPAPAPDIVPVPSGPQQIYRIDKVTPMIASGAQLSWFRNNEGSPREVGGFVGRAVIRGIEGRFSGDLPAELEVNIQQFSPVIVTPTTQDGAVHRVKVDLILRDPITRDEIERSENIFMDLIALTGTASNIARNAGRTPEARLEERIARITSAWANELNCETTRCPIAIAPVVTPAPVPVAEPVPSPEPEPRPAAVAAPPPAPVPVPVVPDAPTPAATPVAEDSDDDGPGFFGRLFGSDESDEPEPAPEPVEVIEPAPAPEPVAEPVAEAPIEEEESEESHGFFAALFGGDDDEEEVEVEDAAPEPVEAPAPAVVEAEPAAPAEAEEAVEAEEGTTIEGFFGNLLGQPEEEPETPVAAVEPAPAPTPVPAAPPAAPVVTPAPAVAPPPAPAAAPTPAPAPAVRIPEVADDEAQSPFFRSPASTAPTLPQTALLGRSQRQNDPLRRQPGDVVLEISNLPAFWDGDVTSGGIWVALPYVPAYRRAVVSNPANGRTVEANLFWRDPQAGGGSTLLSSAAAEALGVAPGQVSNLGVKVVASE